VNQQQQRMDEQRHEQPERKASSRVVGYGWSVEGRIQALCTLLSGKHQHNK
jgi:hypothetical protein